MILVMNREELLNIKPGDYVVHCIGNSKPELVITIEHQTHGIRSNPEDSCCINGLYWYYDDIKNVYKGGIDEFK